MLQRPVTHPSRGFPKNRMVWSYPAVANTTNGFGIFFTYICINTRAHLSFTEQRSTFTLSSTRGVFVVFVVVVRNIESNFWGIERRHQERLLLSSMKETRFYAQHKQLKRTVEERERDESDDEKRDQKRRTTMGERFFVGCDREVRRYLFQTYPSVLRTETRKWISSRWVI